MNEHELGELLRRAVPDAPSLDASAIRHRAHRQRQGRVGVIAGAAAVVGVALVGSVLVRADEPRRGSDVVTGPTGDAGPSAPRPYDDLACGAPASTRPTTTTLAELDDVVAVRLCLDFDPRQPGVQGPATPEQQAEEDDADALVHDLPRFIEQVRRLPAGEPEYCTTDRGPWVQQALVFRRLDGSRALVAAGGCQPVRVEERVVDGEALTRLYVASLDRQRTRHAYTRAFDDELTCSSAPRGGPVMPGREQIVRAIACDLPPGAESIPPDLEPTVLDAGQLAALQRAWMRPGDPVVRDSTGVHPCVDDLPEPPSYLLAVTDHSDVLQLIDSPCGFLVWHGTDRSEGATLAADLRQLGLD